MVLFSIANHILFTSFELLIPSLCDIFYCMCVCHICMDKELTQYPHIATHGVALSLDVHQKAYRLRHFKSDWA